LRRASGAAIASGRARALTVAQDVGKDERHGDAEQPERPPPPARDGRRL
jgi:hypothetical protein